MLRKLTDRFVSQPGVSTDLIDRKVHQMIIDNGAYPSPLTYGEPLQIALPDLIYHSSSFSQISIVIAHSYLQADGFEALMQDLS